MQQEPPGEPHWRREALAFLAEHFPTNAPTHLSDPLYRGRSPWEAEGPIFIYRFAARLSGSDPESFYVVVGETEPNYYPAYYPGHEDAFNHHGRRGAGRYTAHGLGPEDAFNLHLGTRFMLVVGAARAGTDLTAGYDAERDVRRIVDAVAPGEPIEDLLVAAAFDVEGRLHAVLRCRLRSEPVYVFAGECPPGFSRRTHLPPQVAYRLHLGQVLRNEDAASETE